MITQQEALQKLQNHADKLAKVVTGARADIAAVQARKELTEQAKDAAIKARRDELRGEVHSIETECKKALETIKQAAPVGPTIDPAEAMRIWARLERLLESGEDPTTLASRLADEGARTSLIVLREELPSYLQSNGYERRTTEATVKAVAEHERKTLKGSEAEHQQTLEAAEAAAYRLTMNSGFVLKDQETTELLVSGHGDNNNTIQITEED